LGIFFIVDEVLGEGLGHEVFDFFFLSARVMLAAVSLIILVNWLFQNLMKSRATYHVCRNERSQAAQ
jgi:hypothetical protein